MAIDAYKGRIGYGSEEKNIHLWIMNCNIICLKSSHVYMCTTHECDIALNLYHILIMAVS